MDQIIWRCVSEGEMEEILKHYHCLECGGHFNGQHTATIGLIYFRTPTYMSNLVIGVKGQVISEREIRCPRILFWK